jgi:hypothetical protein
VIAGCIATRLSHVRPSADGRVESVDKLTRSDLLRLALDSSRENLRDAVSIVGMALLTASRREDDFV